MEAIKYKIDLFEGPLDLLLSLIQKNKVDIRDIPITLICGQYMEYIEEAHRLDLELAAEFIVMASELMPTKSRMLLPRPPSGEDPRTPLADALLKYAHAREVAPLLARLYAQNSGSYVKDTDEIPPDKNYIEPQLPERLAAAWERVLTRNSLFKQAVSTHFTPMIAAPVIPIEKKNDEIIAKLSLRGRMNLSALLRGADSRADLIAVFICVLELIKSGRIAIVAETDGGEPSGTLDGDFGLKLIELKTE